MRFPYNGPCSPEYGMLKKGGGKERGDTLRNSERQVAYLVACLTRLQQPFKQFMEQATCKAEWLSKKAANPTAIAYAMRGFRLRKLVLCEQAKKIRHTFILEIK